jgi:hypothetical protein
MTRRTIITAAALAPFAALAAEETVAGAIKRLGLPAVWAHVQSMAQSSAGWLLIARRAVFAECLLDACHDLGLRTVGQVSDFADRHASSYAEVGGRYAAVPPIVGPDVAMTRISFHAADQFVLARRSAGDPGDYRIEHNDRTYKAVPQADAERLAAAFPWRSAELYRTNDCEDVVSLFRGWVVQQGYTNLAVGLAGLFMYSGARYTHGHAVPFIFTPDNRVLLIDAGKALPANTVKFAGNTTSTSTTLARLYI